jgi:hypothetical protein
MLKPASSQVYIVLIFFSSSEDAGVSYYFSLSLKPASPQVYTVLIFFFSSEDAGVSM